MLRLRSWASSMMIVSYGARSRSRWISASRIPSVITLTSVRRLGLVGEPDLVADASPSGVASSSAIRSATVRAAMRRGWVWPISPPSRPRPSSRQIFGSCVVLPLPVSPATMTTWCSRMASAMSSLRWLTGRSPGYLITAGRVVVICRQV